MAETKCKYYEVKKGDSLLGISRHTGVPVKTLRELNKLQGDKLQVGQRLRLAP
ncbi:MAG: LysM peptidoglycan-binding domain-containing protein [Thermodesulfobacteriota bacterium]